MFGGGEAKGGKGRGVFDIRERACNRGTSIKRAIEMVGVYRGGGRVGWNGLRMLALMAITITTILTATTFGLFTVYMDGTMNFGCSGCVSDTFFLFLPFPLLLSQ